MLVRLEGLVLLLLALLEVLETLEGGQGPGLAGDAPLRLSIAGDGPGDAAAFPLPDPAPLAVAKSFFLVRTLPMISSSMSSKSTGLGVCLRKAIRVGGFPPPDLLPSDLTSKDMASGGGSSRRHFECRASEGEGGLETLRELPRHCCSEWGRYVKLTSLRESSSGNLSGSHWVRSGERESPPNSEVSARARRPEGRKIVVVMNNANRASGVRCSSSSRCARALPGQRRAGRALGRPRAQSEVAASEPQEKKEKFDARAFRRSLNKTGRYVRKPTHDVESKNLMDEHGVGYSADGLVAQMRDNGFVAELGTNLTIKLAESYGFCWGVERAVQMAYEARRAYPGRQLHITNEIIHNPSVNKRLEEMNVKFIEDRGAENGGKDFSAVEEGDVCILPAFGASVHEMKILNDKRVQIVDTTCPYVSKVWNSVETHTRRKHTSIIHGKWAHEETIATASFAGDYVIVKNMPEAEYVADYILNGGDKADFLSKFKNAISEDFDPDTMLSKVGIANQTTMLKGETMQIGKLFEKTMLTKFGPADLALHFVLMDTICDATQTRQDAMYNLVGAQGTPEGVDVILVVGGYNSSNTCHLQEIAEEYKIPSFWLDQAGRIGPGNQTEWMDAHLKMHKAENWLPEGPLTIGVTSGASTPDKVVEDILAKVCELKL